MRIDKRVQDVVDKVNQVCGELVNDAADAVQRYKGNASPYAQAEIVQHVPAMTALAEAMLVMGFRAYLSARECWDASGIDDDEVRDAIFERTLEAMKTGRPPESLTEAHARGMSEGMFTFEQVAKSMPTYLDRIWKAKHLDQMFDSEIHKNTMTLLQQMMDHQSKVLDALRKARNIPDVPFSTQANVAAAIMSQMDAVDGPRDDES